MINMTRKKYQKCVRVLLTAIYREAKNSGHVDESQLKKFTCGISARNVRPDFAKVYSYAEAWDSLKIAREFYGIN